MVADSVAAVEAVADNLTSRIISRPSLREAGLILSPREYPPDGERQVDDIQHAQSYNREIVTKEHPRIVGSVIMGKFRIAER